MDSVALDFVDDLERTRDVNIGWYKPGHQSNTPFNHAVAPTDNKLIRQAILAAVDSEAIMSSLGPPSTWNMCGVVFICNAVWDSKASLELYNQNDPEKAKRLLAEAGYNGEPIHIKNPTDYGTITPIGPVLKSQLEAVGLNVEMPAQDGPLSYPPSCRRLAGTCSPTGTHTGACSAPRSTPTPLDRACRATTALE